jgi:spore coat protein U-like protein
MRTIIASAAVAAFTATGAMALTDTITVPLTGELAKSCTLDAFLNGPFDALDMQSTATQGAESITVNCNYGGSAQITFSSANGGKLISGANSVDYALEVSGGVLPATVLSAPATGTFSGFSANANASRSMKVTLQQPATVAGTYTDTITATVTPN